jgi:hypothetical protein
MSRQRVCDPFNREEGRGVSDKSAVETEKKVMVETEVAATVSDARPHLRVEVRFEGCWGTTSMSISGV